MRCGWPCQWQSLIISPINRSHGTFRHFIFFFFFIFSQQLNGIETNSLRFFFFLFNLTTSIANRLFTNLLAKYLCTILKIYLKTITPPSVLNLYNESSSFSVVIAKRCTNILFMISTYPYFHMNYNIMISKKLFKNGSHKRWPLICNQKALIIATLLDTKYNIILYYSIILKIMITNLKNI